MAKKKSEEKTIKDGTNKAKSALEAIEQIKERFGDGSIMKFGEARAADVPSVSTGCLSLDIALGVALRWAIR